MSNPFKAGTTSYRDFEIMSDLKWHCTKCELESAQAKTWQVWRQNGIQLDRDEKGNYYERIVCPNCGKTTVHRKLLSLESLPETQRRSGIPHSLVRRVKAIYGFEEAVFLRQLPARQLEIDHRFPQIRWLHDEATNDPSMPETEIRRKFMLLSRGNNLLKSRFCERCLKTGKRGLFPGIYYWYEGEENWSSEIDPHDERGCEGCFWYNPYRWRKEINTLIMKTL